MKIAEFNGLADEDAEELIRSCCGSSRWVSRVLSRRPYVSVDALLAAADTAWQESGSTDWEEAFAHHPRIGESQAAAPVSEMARAWSAGEQGNLNQGAAGVRTDLANGNREYERRFGRIFIVCASGKGPDELLEILRTRLQNSPDVELRIAAAEQGKITNLRLRKLFSDEGARTS